jgi:hypothetical protein
VPCVELPPFPALPDILPLTLTPPPLPTLDLSVDYCCRLQLDISVADYIPLGTVTLAIPGADLVFAAVGEALAQIQTYIDAIPLDCPLD